MKVLRAIIGHVLDFCYPGICTVCGESCEGKAAWCEKCLAKLQTLEQAPACLCCGAPLTQVEAPCPWCGGDGLYPLQNIARLGVFREPLRSLIRQMKYHRRWPLAESLAERLWLLQRTKDLLAAADCIVPVPLHRRQQIWRGYNQSDVIANWLRHRSRRKLIRPLIRVRATQTQTHLHSRQLRAENVRGAFALLDPAKIKGKNVVLVDDVMTTGATLREAARALLAGDPQSISAIVLAVADPRGRDFQSI